MEMMVDSFMNDISMYILYNTIQGLKKHLESWQLYQDKVRVIPPYCYFLTIILHTGSLVIHYFISQDYE